MKRSYRRNKKKAPEIKGYRINRAIKVPEVRFIDEEKGIAEVISIDEALKRAEAAEMDLVEVSPNAKPPVVKVLDYGKVQYQREKMMRKQKAAQKKVDTKGIRLTARISQHDFEVRLNNARRFLTKGAKVKIELLLRGREHQHTEKAKDLLQQFVDTLAEEFDLTIEQAPKKMGNRIHAIIAPKTP
jgi:translation initiation factor IF-3